MLVPILRAAHCRSTHHFFAIDALERIGTERGKRLAELLLKHYARYLKGAKDPDDSFKDFQNHVIHVSQNNWGGAPQKCQHWFDKAMQLLNEGAWSEAAYACGVLSHYFTDPIMPLHTGQTERESVVHRPMEWSICKAYDEIYSLCQFARASRQIRLSNEDNWLSQAVLQGAAMAHEHYSRLIEIYNLARGTVDPPRGLTKESRQILAELFDLAIGGWASILMRMAAQMNSVPPDCSLTLATVIAGIDMPRAAVIKKFSDAAQRQEVKRIFDEFTETGKVIDNLPAEIKTVRQEFIKDQKAQAATSSTGLQAGEPTSSTGLQARNSSGSTGLQARNLEAMEPSSSTEPIEEPIGHVVSEPTSIHSRDNAPDRVEPQQPAAFVEVPKPEVAARPTKSEQAKIETQRDVKSLTASHLSEVPEARLTWDSPLVDAPSIGPKTAKRFTEIGIETVQQFLESDATEVAEALNTSWIKPELIEDWQDQAQLVCEVPALCGYKAQLLVAVNCRNVEDLAEANIDELHDAISQFGQTKEAERILRSTAVPDEAEIAKWIASAKQWQAANNT